MERLVLSSGTVKNLAQIGEWVIACCAENGFNARDTYMVQLAVDEACANVFEHGYDKQPGPLQLDATFEQEILTFFIRDWGHSFDPEMVTKPNLKALLADRPVGGLGMFLMQHVMDEVHYHFDVGNGNLLKLIKRKA